MAEQPGFVRTPRRIPASRPVPLRLLDWREIGGDWSRAELEQQAGRCMDCGVAFCHGGCPLGNLIPEWNELVTRGDWREAAERLHATNNFPEFTGLLCPAPCESACVLAINSDPVTIKAVEAQIIDRAWESGWVRPVPPGPAAIAAGRQVAVVGSGPAGLAAAQQLTRAGHAVTVFERDDQPGGLIRYGIPEFKMEKWRLDRRLDQMRAEGTVFRCGVDVGADLTAARLRADFDAVVLAGGARVPRTLPVPGADLAGIHYAMDYLTTANREVAGRPPGPRASDLSARGRRVVIVGGGDTGADCLGTVLRQGAESAVQLEIKPKPPSGRPDDQPWPMYPMIYRVSGAYEEGGDRWYAASTLQFLADPAGRVRALRIGETMVSGGRRSSRPGTEREFEADMVLLAMGFTGAEPGALLDGLGIGLDERGNVVRDDGYATAADGVFVAGDMGRGQSLIVWAIAEGRSAAAAADRYLMSASSLPPAIPATARPFSLRG